jgi:hypothetical protein
MTTLHNVNTHKPTQPRIQVIVHVGGDNGGGDWEIIGASHDEIDVIWLDWDNFEFAEDDTIEGMLAEAQSITDAKRRDDLTREIQAELDRRQEQRDIDNERRLGQDAEEVAHAKAVLAAKGYRLTEPKP